MQQQNIRLEHIRELQEGQGTVTEVVDEVAVKILWDDEKVSRPEWISDLKEV